MCVYIYIYIYMYTHVCVCVCVLVIVMVMRHGSPDDSLRPNPCGTQWAVLILY